MKSINKVTELYTQSRLKLQWIVLDARIGYGTNKNLGNQLICRQWISNAERMQVFTRLHILPSVKVSNSNRSHHFPSAHAHRTNGKNETARQSGNTMRICLIYVPLGNDRGIVPTIGGGVTLSPPVRALLCQATKFSIAFKLGTLVPLEWILNNNKWENGGDWFNSDHV